MVASFLLRHIVEYIIGVHSLFRKLFYRISMKNDRIRTAAPPRAILYDTISSFRDRKRHAEGRVPIEMQSCIMYNFRRLMISEEHHYEGYG